MQHIDPERKLRRLGWWLHGIGLLVVLAIGVCTEFLVYRPLASRADACAARADRLQGLLRRDEEVRHQHARLLEELAEARQQAAILENRIPNEPREADFLAQVSQLAADVELRILDYRPGAVIQKPDYSVVRVDLICEGGYSSICSFLDQVSQLPRHSTVVNLQIDTAGGGRKYPAKISLELYFWAKGRSGAYDKGQAMIDFGDCPSSRTATMGLCASQVRNQSFLCPKEKRNA